MCYYEAFVVPAPPKAVVTHFQVLFFIQQAGKLEKPPMFSPNQALLKGLCNIPFTRTQQLILQATN
jgi:hypothetical protein